MDPRYHVAALREMRPLVSGAQSAHSVHAGAAPRCRERSAQRPNRRPARRVGGLHTSDRGRTGFRRCDQASAHSGADHTREPADEDNCAAQHRINLLNHRDQASRTVIPGSSSVDS